MKIWELGRGPEFRSPEPCEEKKKTVTTCIHILSMLVDTHTQTHTPLRNKRKCLNEILIR